MKNENLKSAITCDLDGKVLSFSRGAENIFGYKSKDVVGKTDPLTGLPAHGFLDPLKGWGGFGMYFLTDRAGPYVKHPDDPAFLFDIDTMKPRINNPGWVQAIQDVMDLIKIEGAYPADQINADPGTTGFLSLIHI